MMMNLKNGGKSEKKCLNSNSLKVKALFALSFLLFACPLVFSQENGSDADSQESVSASAENTSDEESEDKNDSSEEKSKDDSKKIDKKRKFDPILKEAYWECEKYDFKKGLVHVYLDRTSGTFGFSAISDDESETPVLSDVDRFSKSFSVLSLNGKSYNLADSGSVKRTVRKLTDENRGQISYTIKNKIQVVVDFSLEASRADSAVDSLVMTFNVINLSGRNEKISLYSLFDTILGEGFSSVMSTATGYKISSEKQYFANELRKEKYLISRNDYTSLQFVFYDEEVALPAIVSVAGYDLLAKNPWKYSCVENRGFHSVNRHSDSAVLVNWGNFTLLNGKTYSFKTRLTVGVDGRNPSGIRNSDYVQAEEPIAVESEPFEKESEENEKKVSSPVVQNQENVDTQKSKVQNAEEKKEAVEPMPKKEVDFVVPSIKDYQLDPDYIQGLIDRINVLQSDPDNVDTSEIKRLNAELDAILEKIRQQK